MINESKLYAKSNDAEDGTALVSDEVQRKEILDKLAGRINDLFQERATRRAGKESEWARDQRLYNSPLQGSNANLSDKPFGPNDTAPRRPEPNIVRTKCDTAIANCVSLQFAAGEKNWDLFPPANTVDQAVTNACRLMEKEIEAQLANSKYGMHSRRAMEDRVILGTGVLKGPVNTGKVRVHYERSPDGTWLPKVSDEKNPLITHVPLWRFYPDDTVTDFSECEDAIEIHPMTAIELSQYANHPGFDKAAIRGILRGTETDEPVKPDAYNDTLVRLTAEVWSRNPYMYKNRYLVLEYHGPITYDTLNKLGLAPTYELPTAEYYGEVWVCAGRVIRMELENIEGYCETPYACSIWKRDPTSPFGYGHPLLLADPQQVVTQAYHMILDNASLTSGPQIAMFKKYIQPIDGDWTIKPNKVWLLTDPTATIDNAIKFFNPTNVIGNIMPVLELARQFADEESATLAFGGMQSPQATDTATGGLLMQHASSTLLDFSAEEWDDQITEKLIRRMYGWNMQYNPKEEIKGDFTIDVKSSSEYKNKQMYIRDLERLSVEAVNNPEMAMVINTDELTRARLALMHLPSNRILKTEEEIAQAQQAAAQKPDPRMIELQIKQMEAQTAQGTLELKKMELQFQSAQQQQRELWEHEEKMGANQARLAEANSSVLKARSEVQVEMIKLAQKDEHFKARLAADAQMNQLGHQADVFLASMQETRKQQENDLYQEELRIKEKTGSGI
jgi:hypothetical protein